MTPDECRSIACEGERFLREGDAVMGIKTLERALQCNTRDLPLQCAIHSQLGNAYYACGDYCKARENHMADFCASRLLKDDLQQAKALSNLSATYIWLSDFANAIDCAKNVIKFAKKIEDKSLECRGLYSLGLAYLQHAIRIVSDCDAYEDDHLIKSVEYFELNLEIAKERQDRVMCGLGHGNLGNAYFYLRKYELSIEHHEKRIKLAKELGDRASIRRAYSNIGNAYAQLENYEKAANFYRLALELACEMNIPELIDQLNEDLENINHLLEKQNKTETAENEDCTSKQLSNATFTSVGINSSFGTESVNLCLSDVINADERSDNNELFEQIDRLSKRIYDQRTNIKPKLQDANSVMDSKDIGDVSSRHRLSLPKKQIGKMMKSLSLKKIGVGTPKRGKPQKEAEALSCSSSSSNRPKSTSSLKIGLEKFRKN